MGRLIGIGLLVGIPTATLILAFTVFEEPWGPFEKFLMVAGYLVPVAGGRCWAALRNQGG